MIDFHSHALPGVDDGSRNLEETLEILDRAADQGVTAMALTPHFYADADTPQQFLLRRAAAMETLSKALRPHHPRVLLGAEVAYFPGIHQCREIPLLRLEGTSYLLLEMPFVPWTERMLDEVLMLNQQPGVDVVLAHIDWYLKFQQPQVLEYLLDSGILMQANAGSFLHWQERRKMLHMVQEGSIAFLGSDCHNLTTRPPLMGDALAVIRKKLGPEVLEALERRDPANKISPLPLERRII